MFDEIFKIIEQRITEAATRIADRAASFFARRMSLFLKNELRVAFTKKEAADFLRVTEPTVKKLMASGELGYFKSSGGDNGRVTIGIHHLLGYLRSIEHKAASRNRIELDDFFSLKSELEVSEKGLRLVADNTRPAKSA